MREGKPVRTTGTVLCAAAFLAATGLMAVASDARAAKECVPRESYVVCPDAPDGGIAEDRNGRVLCGAGACVRNPAGGGVLCAATPGGGAAIASNGRAYCEGGCVRGDERRCVTVR
jgi:hypothetical protein